VGLYAALLVEGQAQLGDQTQRYLSDLRNVLEVQATCGRGQREQAAALAKHHTKGASAATAAKLLSACDVSTRTE
ncbi:MAG: hypothetical protein KUG77_01875, partial [Nannocystaceae bacterium]|nr:hypothetical protein [Nannocystaceae bacterium]